MFELQVSDKADLPFVMKPRLLLIPILLLLAMTACTPGPRVHMYGGMDSHDGPYYGAGWDYDSHNHHKKHKKHKKCKKCKKYYKKYKKHLKKHHHDDDD